MNERVKRLQARTGLPHIQVRSFQIVGGEIRINGEVRDASGRGHLYMDDDLRREVQDWLWGIIFRGSGSWPIL